MNNTKDNKKGLSKTGLVISAVLFLLILAVIAAVLMLKPSSVLKPEVLDGDGFYRTAFPLNEAVYPEMKPYPAEMGRNFDEEYEAWSECVEAQRRELDFSPELEDFYFRSMEAFLKDSESENPVFSPLNLYMSLSMLAEASGGESREEILEALNCPDMESLRLRASDLWNAHYRRDGATSLVLANSLWLRDDMDYKSEALKSLADNYYASSFSGTMGSEEYNRLLQTWLNEQTDYLLSDSVGNEGFDTDTVMALASSLCYRAKWNQQFQPGLTMPALFFSPSGEKEIDFMHSSFTGQYYWADNFGAVELSLANGGGSMSFILPDRGSSPEDVLKSPRLMDFIFSQDVWEDSEYLIINLALPKFDVKSGIELKEGLKELGVEKVFGEEADFSPLTDTDGIFLSDASHAARVAVDEEGVSAAAYTLMAMAGSGRPPEEELDFTLDRPFIFIINSDCGQPLFAGVVNEP